jgi:hypothetical protein
MVLLFDDEFRKTGWSPKCYTVSARPATRFKIAFRSLGDPWDRFACVIANGVEVIRAVTPFDGELEQEVVVPEALGAALGLGDKVCGILTTFTEDGWRYRVEALDEAVPRVLPVPLFLMERMTSSRRSIEAVLQQPVYAEKLYLYITGHSNEEGETRRFRIVADGWRKLFDGTISWGWVPGQGYVTPYELKVGWFVRRIRIESPDCKDYWVVSAALGAPARQPPSWLAYAPMAAAAFAGSALVSYLASRGRG